MAQLKDLIVNGASRLIGDAFVNKIQINSISAYTSSAKSAYGLGSAGQVLKSDGTNAYWANDSKKQTITLTTSWGGNGPYTQNISLNNITANTKVDLQPDATVISQLAEDGVLGLYISNNNGTLTAYSVGEKPTVALTIQCTTTEVA